jgi:energy-coupling factor transporter ATP-binding protein EcfA2
VDGVSAGYRGKTVIDRVTTVFSGKVLLLGPNGAGKTTLFRAIAGIADIYSGTILVDGADVAKASAMAGLLALNLPEAYRLLPVDCYRLLRPKLLLEDLLACMLVFSMVVATIIVSSILLSWHKFGLLVTPQNPLWLIAILLMFGLFFYLLSTVMTRLILVFAGTKTLQTTLTMTPLAMSFIPYATLFTEAPKLLAYAYPPVALQALAAEVASGVRMPLTGIIPLLREIAASKHIEYYVDVTATLVSYLVWVAGLALIAVLLSKRIKAVHPEELMI